MTSLFRAQTALFIQRMINATLAGLEALFWPGRIPPPNEVQSICVNRVGQVGDMLCAVPALYAIREAFPRARLTLLSTTANPSKPGADALLGGATWIDHLWMYDPKPLRRFTNLKKFRADLQRSNFDIWIDLPQDFSKVSRLLRNMLFVKTLGVRWSRGYRFNNFRLFAKDQERHHQTVGEVQRLLDYVKAFGIPVSGGQFPLPVANADRQVIDGIFEQYHLDRARLMAVAPGGKRVTNLWPTERFGEIARRWVTEGGQVVVIGGAAEVQMGKDIEAAAAGKAISLCGKTTLLQAIELLRRCAILVSNDSGPVHMAAAVGTPCAVANTASQLPWHWAPWGPHHRLLRKPVHCSPCFLNECPENNLCLREVQTDEMWGALGAIRAETATRFAPVAKENA